MRKIFNYSLLLVLFLAACSSPGEAPVPTPEPPTTQVCADPDAIVAFQSAELHAMVRARLSITESEITCRDMDALQTLTVNGLFTTDDISTLVGLEAATNLHTLSISNTNISNLDPIQHLAGIRELNLTNNKISNIDALAGITGLTRLQLSGNDEISDFSAIHSFTDLTALGLPGKHLHDFGFIANYSELHTFELIGGTHLVDLNDLSAVIPQLSRLTIRRTNISDVSATHDAPELTHLTLTGNPIVSLVGVANFPKLERLEIRDSALTTLDGFSGAPLLEYVTVSENPNLKDIKALNQLAHLKVVDVSNNVLETLDGFGVVQKPRLANFELNNNYLQSLEPLKDMELSQLTRLTITENCLDLTSGSSDHTIILDIQSDPGRTYGLFLGVGWTPPASPPPIDTIPQRDPATC